jgi:hypothetical protein
MLIQLFSFVRRGDDGEKKTNKPYFRLATPLHDLTGERGI